MTNFKKIIEFHQTFPKARPTEMEEIFNLRQALMTEEFHEVDEALENLRKDPNNKNLKAELLKELTDLLYVTYGTIETLGWDADTAFKEVHDSNMSKVGADGKPMYRADGKLQKGPNYHKPDMTKFVE